MAEDSGSPAPATTTTTTTTTTTAAATPTARPPRPAIATHRKGRRSSPSPSPTNRTRTPSPSTPTVTFATPLPQSPRSSTLTWRFPRPFSHLTLIGKSRAAWHTSFIIPELNLLLDAGLIVNNLRPKHVFVTHGHSDHSLMVPVFISTVDPPDIYCPVEMESVLGDYLRSKVLLNAGGGVAEMKAWKEKRQIEEEEEEDSDGDEEIETDGGVQLDDVDDDPRVNEAPTHFTHGLTDSSTVTLRRHPNISATAFDCDHKVPCLGYVFHQTSQKLRPEYTSLSGPEIKALRESGTPITYESKTPIFAFLGDTTVHTLSSEPSWLKDVKVVITECSFLYEEHRKNAEKTKHTIWGDLEKVVRKYKDTTFVLIHFSLRYSVEDIRAFFEGLEDRPENIVVWVDGGK